jgi:hypothetical protein
LIVAKCHLAVPSCHETTVNGSVPKGRQIFQAGSDTHDRDEQFEKLPSTSRHEFGAKMPPVSEEHHVKANASIISTERGSRFG